MGLNREYFPVISINLVLRNEKYIGVDFSPLILQGTKPIGHWAAAAGRQAVSVARKEIDAPPALSPHPLYKLCKVEQVRAGCLDACFHRGVIRSNCHYFGIQFSQHCSHLILS